MAIQIQLRRGTAAQWTSSNPTLAAGEIGVETDTNKLKMGDGSTAWNSLDYTIPNYSLDQLSNVTISSAVSGEALTWNGSAWVNTDLTSTITAALVDSAPETLDTLNELAAALGDDANFANTIANTIATKADASHTHSLVDVTDITASATELNYVDGVTSSIQTQLDGKQAIVSGVSDTEIGYLDGVTSGIQGQLDNKAPKLSVPNYQTSNYTLLESDTNKLIMANAALTITIPSGVFSAGARVDFIQNAAQTLTFSAGPGMTLYSKDGALTIDTQYAGASVYFYTSSSAYIIGDLA